MQMANAEFADYIKLISCRHIYTFNTVASITCMFSFVSVFLFIYSFTHFNGLSHRKTDKKIRTSLTLVLQIGKAWTETG